MVTEPEEHPFFHDFDNGLVHDEVLAKQRNGKITEVRRIETCSHCSIERVRRIDTVLWIYLTNAYYRRRRKIIRKPRTVYLFDNFMRHTNLPKDKLVAPK